MADNAALSPAAAARALIRACDRASLATLARATAPGAGGPYASLVLSACDHDASPILLISRLADHTRNLEADSRAALLFDGTAGLASPLTGVRATVVGHAQRSAESRHRARFLARHPDAAHYAGFADFEIWRVNIEHVHLVAGFGRIHWLAGREITFDAGASVALARHEAEIVAQMNAEHLEALQLYAARLLQRGGEGWTMTGIDPEGIDLRRKGEVARIPFAAPVNDPATARAELARLAKAGRAA